MAHSPTPGLKEVLHELTRLSSAEDAHFLQRYFRSEPGGYGEGDRFRGIRVPQLRVLARRYADFALARQLIGSVFHEDRLLALLMLVRLFDRGDEATRADIYNFYLANTRFINNWDLVDASAPYIVGPYLDERSREPLYQLARPASLWERRIAIISTLHFIRNDDFDDTYAIAEILLCDPHDLIHKATGWMLREAGKRDQPGQEAFLKRHYHHMPRTMLRYAIEKFPEEKRRAWLKGAPA